VPVSSSERIGKMGCVCRSVSATHPYLKLGAKVKILKGKFIGDVGKIQISLLQCPEVLGFM
jgi:hypothetical protein